jgi:hypothetical protein
MFVLLARPTVPITGKFRGGYLLRVALHRINTNQSRVLAYCAAGLLAVGVFLLLLSPGHPLTASALIATGAFFLLAATLSGNRDILLASQDTLAQIKALLSDANSVLSAVEQRLSASSSPVPAGPDGMLWIDNPVAELGDLELSPEIS